MTVEINPLEARRLREAFKNTQEAEISDGSIECDKVWIFGDGRGHNKEQTLSLEKDGVAIAHIKITNGTLKRLKGEFLHWKQIGSGTVRRDWGQ